MTLNPTEQKPDYTLLKQIVEDARQELDKNPDARTASYSIATVTVEAAARSAHMELDAALSAIGKRTSSTCRLHNQTNEIVMCLRDDTYIVDLLTHLVTTNGPDKGLHLSEDGETGRMLLVNLDTGERVGEGETLRQAVRAAHRGDARKETMNEQAH